MLESSPAVHILPRPGFGDESLAATLLSPQPGQGFREGEEDPVAHGPGGVSALTTATMSPRTTHRGQGEAGRVSCGTSDLT